MVPSVKQFFQALCLYMCKKISNEYIVGFVDGEGSFTLSMRRDVRHDRVSKAVYYSWKASFAINLHCNDAELLISIKEYFGVGSVSNAKVNKAVLYQVNDLEELVTVIVPFFQRNKLIGKKAYDFDLWQEAIKILYKYKLLKEARNSVSGKRGFQKVEWEESDIERMKEINELMKEYKGNRLKKWSNNDIGRSTSNK